MTPEQKTIRDNILEHGFCPHRMDSGGVCRICLPRILGSFHAMGVNTEGIYNLEATYLNPECSERGCQWITAENALEQDGVKNPYPAERAYGVAFGRLEDETIEHHIAAIKKIVETAEKNCETAQQDRATAQNAAAEWRNLLAKEIAWRHEMEQRIEVLVQLSAKWRRIADTHDNVEGWQIVANQLRICAKNLDDTFK